MRQDLIIGRHVSDVDDDCDNMFPQKQVQDVGLWRFGPNKDETGGVVSIWMCGGESK